MNSCPAHTGVPKPEAFVSIIHTFIIITIHSYYKYLVFIYSTIYHSSERIPRDAPKQAEGAEIPVHRNDWMDGWPREFS